MQNVWKIKLPKAKISLYNTNSHKQVYKTKKSFAMKINKENVYINIIFVTTKNKWEPTQN